jgi:ArsR family transcriptional regulator
MKSFAAVFKALSDASRLRIINLLFSSGELCVCDIEEVMGFTQTKVSRHLAYLRKAGLVDDRKKGLWMLYSVAKPRDAEHKKVLDFLADMLRSDAVARRDAERLASRIRKGCCTTYAVVNPGSIPAIMELNKN